MKLVLLGPPGIGKGTQAKILAEKYNLLHLSTGDILRHEITQKTKLGHIANNFINDGQLVPDDVMLHLMDKRLKQKDAQKGYILDGFPRTLSQGIGLEEILEKQNQKLDSVFLLEGNNEKILERLSGRRTCRLCGEITNLLLESRKDGEKCNRCGGELYQRDDDKPDVIRERLEVYRLQTEPLIFFYSRKSLLKKVNGMGTIKQVFNLIIEKLPK